MHGVLQRRVADARKIERNVLQGAARICSPSFGKVCKALWPHKTAEELASRTGASVRTAAYEISGEHFPSCHSLKAVFDEIVPPRA